MLMKWSGGEIIPGRFASHVSWFILEISFLRSCIYLEVFLETGDITIRNLKKMFPTGC